MSKKVKHYERHQYRASVREFVDQDYYCDLNDEDKEYLDQFNQEYYLNNKSFEDPIHGPEYNKALSDADNARRRDISSILSYYLISDAVESPELEKILVTSDFIADSIKIYGYEGSIDKLVDDTVDRIDGYEDNKEIILELLFNTLKIIRLEKSYRRKLKK